MIPLTILDVTRSLLAFGVYTILPGSGLVYILYRKRHLRIMEFVSLSIGWSLAVNAIVAYGAHFTGGTLTAYGNVIILLDVVAGIYLLIKILQKPSADFAVNRRNLLIIMLVGLIGLAWFGVILQNGPRIDYAWDQWFHIAHVREVIESDRVIPNNPFWSDVALSETYGLWHIVLGAAGRTFGVDVLVLWRVGNAYLAFISFIVMYVVANMVLNDSITSLLAAVVFLGSGVGAQEITRTFIYPWGISYLCLWLSLGQFFHYWKVGTRVSLLTATVIGLMPIFIHPQEYIMLCFAIFVLGGSVFLLPTILHKVALVSAKKIWIFFALLLILGGPLLLTKYSNRIMVLQQGSSRMSGLNPDLPLYGHPLAALLAMAFPYFEKIGLLYFAVINFNIISLLCLKMLPAHLDAKTRWFLTTLTWAPLVAAVAPGVSWLTQKVLLETYSWRLLNLIPSPMIWALLIRKWLPVENRSESKAVVGSKKKKVIGRAYSVMGILLVAVVAISIAHTVAQNEMEPAVGTVEEEDISPLQSRRGFDRLDQLMAEPGTVLSDPTTSYAIPGLTKHYIVLNEPSHGSRNDILLRFAETRELLSSPAQSAAEARATLRRYGVDFIVVHNLWLDKTFFAGTPFYSEYTLKFLRDNPACFQLVYRDASFEAFQYLQCASADIRHKNLPSEVNVFSKDIEYVKEYQFTDNLSLLGFSLPDGQEFIPGEALPIEVYWRADASIREPYAVWLELLCEYPGEQLPYGRLLRRARELVTGRIFRVEEAAWMLPPPSGLERGDTLMQSFALRVPPNLAEGPCELNLYVLSRHQAMHDQKILPVLLMEKKYTFPSIQLREVEVKR